MSELAIALLGLDPFQEHLLRIRGAPELVGIGPGLILGLVLAFLVLGELLWRLVATRRGYDPLEARLHIGVAIGHAIGEGVGRIVWTLAYFWVWSLTPLHLFVLTLHR